LIKRLEDEFEFIIAARNHDCILSILDVRGLDYFVTGKHGGSGLDTKLVSYARNVEKLIPFVKKEKPDLLLTERWPVAVRVAFGFDIPAWTLYFDEREKHVNRMVFPLSEKIFVPEFYTAAELRKDGVEPEKITWFRGFHACYMKNQKIKSKNPFHEMGYKSPIVLVRPEPEFASFFGQQQPVLEQVVNLLSVENSSGIRPNIFVIPRTDAQAARYAKYPVTLLTESFIENPVVYADVTVGAAETMLMESFVVGTPAISTVYWPESKPLMALHQYIPHLVDPEKVVSRTLEYLNEGNRKHFFQQSRKIVDLMDNPIDKYEAEILKVFTEPKSQTPPRRRKRRSQMDICVEIIESVSFQALKPTHIMQRTNVSHSRIKRIINNLLKKELIVEHNGGYLQATSEGLSTAEEYRKVQDKLF
jgi:predicted glycosyltransferase/predicted transcriptional regulator